jgi:hypothetical protein
VETHVNKLGHGGYFKADSERFALAKACGILG